MYDHGGVSTADPTPPAGSPDQDETDTTAAAPAVPATPAVPAAPAAPAVPAAPPVRQWRPARDILLSLGLLIVPLLVLMALCQPSGNDIATVDPSGTYRAARAEAKFPVLTPTDLSDGYRATNAALNRLEGGAVTVRVSYLTPSKKYLQLVQSDVDSEKLIVAELGAGKIQGTADVRGVAWQQYGGRRPGETALVLLGPKATVMVTGDASVGDMRAFAATLR